MAEINMATEWVRLFEKISDDVRAVSSEFREKDATGNMSVKDKRMIGKQVNDVAASVGKLNKILEKMENNPFGFNVGEGELNRRRGMMTRLQAEAQKLDDLVSGKAARAQLGAGRKKEYVDTDETRDWTNREILQQQQSVMERQDEHLDNILAGVSKLKVMSEDINQELDLHAHLLDDLSQAVDSTDARLQASTLKVQDVAEKEASCIPLCIIVILLVVIGVVAFV